MTKPLKITRGSTFADTLQWATEECRVVTATLNATAPVTLDIVGHGLPDEWLVTIEGHPRISETDEFRVNVVDADTLSIPCLNGLSFGSDRTVALRYKPPVDMSGYTARMQIRDKDGVLLLELTTENGRIEIDNVGKKINRTIEADVTEAITWKRGFYDLEMVSGDYVIKIDSGTVEVDGEVTV